MKVRSCRCGCFKVRGDTKSGARIARKAIAERIRAKFQALGETTEGGHTVRISEDFMERLARGFLSPLRSALADGGEIQATAKSLDAARDGRAAFDLCGKLRAIVGQMMCSDCGGSGTVENQYREPCPRCHGGASS